MHPGAPPCTRAHVHARLGRRCAARGPKIVDFGGLDGPWAHECEKFTFKLPSKDSNKQRRPGHKLCFIAWRALSFYAGLFKPKCYKKLQENPSRQTTGILTETETFPNGGGAEPSAFWKGFPSPGGPSRHPKSTSFGPRAAQRKPTSDQRFWLTGAPNTYPRVRAQAHVHLRTAMPGASFCASGPGFGQSSDKEVQESPIDVRGPGCP